MTDPTTVRLLVKRLNSPFEFDHQRVAFAVYLVADGYLDPAFADAVLGDVKAFFVVKADADVVLKDGADEVRAALVGGEVVWQRWAFCGFGHVYLLFLGLSLNQLDSNGLSQGSCGTGKAAERHAGICLIKQAVKGGTACSHAAGQCSF